MEPARDTDAGLVTEDSSTIVEVALDIAPEKRGGLFCNAAGIHADADAVTIDFASVDPGGIQSAVLQSRVRLSHRMAVRLLESLAANIHDWLPKELDARGKEQATLERLLEQLDSQEAEDA